VIITTLSKLVLLALKCYSNISLHILFSKFPQFTEKDCEHFDKKKFMILLLLYRRTSMYEKKSSAVHSRLIRKTIL
jgi:hypothetical protein